MNTLFMFSSQGKNRNHMAGHRIHCNPSLDGGTSFVIVTLECFPSGIILVFFSFVSEVAAIARVSCFSCGNPTFLILSEEEKWKSRVSLPSCPKFRAGNTPLSSCPKSFIRHPSFCFFFWFLSLCFRLFRGAIKRDAAPLYS